MSCPIPSFLAGVFSALEVRAGDPLLSSAPQLATAAGRWPGYDKAIVIDCLATRNNGGYEIDRLGRGRTLIMIDQRSGGRSELVQDKECLVLSRYVEDIEALRTHFGLQKMVLAGQSFGAIVAASYAAKHPDRIERLMFWSPGPPTSAFARDREAAINRFLGEADVRRVAEIWNRMAGGPDSEVVSLCREWLRIYFRFYVSDPAALSRMKETTVLEHSIHLVGHFYGLRVSQASE